ncbi:MAG: ATPase domain-containing protein, partial [Burkholderiales bacterium]
MAKAKSVYSCTECGGQVLKWQGQCPHCQAWNTLVETIAEAAPSGANRYGRITEAGRPQRLSEVEAHEEHRIPSGIEEFDRVLGGGLVPGGVVLIGGEPGIGKSTLLLQSLAGIGKSRRALYVTGEESPQQVALRAKRLGVDAGGIIILADT